MAVDPRPAAPVPEVLPARVTPAAFTRAFVRRAVTEERVAKSLAGLSRRTFRFGPYTVGSLAGVRASGSLGTPRIHVADPDEPSYAVTVPATVDLVVRLGTESRLRADVEIELLLTPRPAEPLLLVITVAPIRRRDVRLALHGTGLGLALRGLLRVLEDDLRARIARQVTGLLDGEGVRASRTVDVAAKVDGTQPGPVPAQWRWLDDEAFGRAFVRHTVTVERVQDVFAGFAGDPVAIGPLRAGPRGVVRVSGTGTVGAATVRAAGEAAFDVAMPLEIDLVVELGRDNRFHASVGVPVRVAVHPAEGLTLVVDIAEVAASDVRVRTRSGDRVADFVGRAGRLEEQVAANVAREVNRRVLGSTGRVIDIGERVDGGR